jgi:DNA ligase-associated metallophosphoesterase
MNGYQFSLGTTQCVALPEGALWVADGRVLVVSDLHLGKSLRMARLGGAFLPPYENTETLWRLDELISKLRPQTVICLGDSFDDIGAAHEIPDDIILWITRMQAGRKWIWITGNHDPGPLPFGGSNCLNWTHRNLCFQHIADPNSQMEVSGHYHPKTTVRSKGRAVTRPCFLVDAHRVILPAFGTFTGGLRASSPILSGLMHDNALAVLTGKTAIALPMKQGASIDR